MWNETYPYSNNNNTLMASSTNQQNHHSAAASNMRSREQQNSPRNTASHSSGHQFSTQQPKRLKQQEALSTTSDDGNPETTESSSNSASFGGVVRVKESLPQDSEVRTKKRGPPVHVETNPVSNTTHPSIASIFSDYHNKDDSDDTLSPTLQYYTNRTAQELRRRKLSNAEKKRLTIDAGDEHNQEEQFHYHNEDSDAPHPTVSSILKHTPYEYSFDTTAAATFSDNKRSNRSLNDAPSTQYRQNDSPLLIEEEDISLSEAPESSSQDNHSTESRHSPSSIESPSDFSPASSPSNNKSGWEFSSFLHPITFMGLCLSIFRYSVSKLTSLPFLFISYITRLYLTFSLSVARHSFFVFRKFLYFSFIWWWWTLLCIMWNWTLWGLWRVTGHTFFHSSPPASNESRVSSPDEDESSNASTDVSRQAESRRVPSRRRRHSKAESSSSSSRSRKRSSSRARPSHKLQRRATKTSIEQFSPSASRKTTSEESKAIRDLFHVVPSDRQYKYVVHIPEGRFIPHDQKYRILMKEHQKFSIVLCNDDDNPCCCVILVDGKHVGNVRMEAHSFGSLNRSAYTRKRFVFESKTEQLRRIHSMESMSSPSFGGRWDQDDSTSVSSSSSTNAEKKTRQSQRGSRHTRILSQEEPVTPPPRVPKKTAFEVEVIFCPIDRSFWVRYRKLMFGYAVIALLLYRFKLYVPFFILSTYFILIPLLFGVTYVFFYRDHQVLVNAVLEMWKQFNQNMRHLLIGQTEDEPDFKRLNVQQYIGDEDLYFDSNNAVRVKLNLIPVMTHQFMNQNVIRKHREEHARLHRAREAYQKAQQERSKRLEKRKQVEYQERVRHESIEGAPQDIDESGEEMAKEQRSTPTSSLVPASPLRKMIKSSRPTRILSRFISAPQRLLSKKVETLSIQCWRHVLTFLEPNSVEFFKLRFVSYPLQRLVDEKVFDEIERMRMG